MNSTVNSLNEVHAMLQRKLGLAKTSLAYSKGTNKKTVERLCGQIVAVQMSIQHFSR